MNKDTKSTRGLEVNVGELLSVLAEKWWMILLSGIVGMMLFFFGTKMFVVPEYQSVTKIFVLSQENGNYLTSTDLQLSSYLTKDYAELIKSRTVAEEVIERLELELSPEGLMGMVSVQIKSDTRVVAIVVKNRDPELARQLANEVREVSAKQIVDVMGVQAVNVVDEANLPQSPSGPNVTKNMFMGAAWGILIAVALILFLHLSDDTIKSTDDVERYLGLTVLASIPVNVQQESGKRGFTQWRPSK